MQLLMVLFELFQKVAEPHEEPIVRKAPEPELLPPPPPPAPVAPVAPALAQPAPAPPAPVKAEPPVMTTIPQPRVHIPSMNPAASSMSRRNLETIVEAIRHLEGDSFKIDSFKKPIASCSEVQSSPRDIPHSEGESEKESSMYSDEEIKSESSGRESPLFKPHHTTAMATIHVRQEPVTVAHPGGPMPQVGLPGVINTDAHIISATTAPAPHFVSAERYPIATQLLHRPSLPQPYIHRPAVIVQNLS